MQIDQQTLNDLDIFRAEEESVSLFTLIDKTKTTGGSYCLHEKLMYPPDSFGKLIQQQKSIRYFAESKAVFQLPMGEMQLKAVEEYFETNIEVVATGQWLSSLQFCLSDKSSFRFLKSSLPEAIRFVETLKQMLHQEGNNLPVILQQINAQVESLWNDSSFKKAREITRRPSVSFHQWLQADRLLRTKLKERYEALIKFFFELDALLAMAITMREMGFHFPEWAESGETFFNVEGMYHPLLKHAVPLSLNMQKEHNFVFLTGPNMSGKTTLLKALGLTVYLAHVGMGVPAKTAHISYVDRLMTGITFADNIATGYSYFFSEVKRVKQLAGSLSNGEKVFAIYDELFRGTNVKDALDASTMIISGLMAWKESLFVISSHLTEIGETVRSFQNTQSIYFESSLVDEKPIFTYRLLEGVSTMRLGMTLIDNEGIMKMLKKVPRIG
jgi:DNA mismatch repair ATPase MutS